MAQETALILFKEMIRFPHVCSKEKFGEEPKIDFELNGPLSHAQEQTQFIVKCLDCGYHHSLFIPTEDALTIRQFCIEKGAYSSERFQRLDCYLCRKGQLQFQCAYSVKGLVGACKGFAEEEDEFNKYVTRQVFPEWFNE